MKDPENQLSGRFDGMVPEPQREQMRLQALTEFGLLEVESVPVFEEATQTAAHLLEMPICILGIMDRDRQYFKAAVGLSRLGLMNDLAATRMLPRQHSLCAKVVDSRKVVALGDTSTDAEAVQSSLVQNYGIRAYLGVPLIVSSGHCVGTLAVMDLVPRVLTSREIEYLEITARWCLSEYERNRLLKADPSTLGWRDQSVGQSYETQPDYYPLVGNPLPSQPSHSLAFLNGTTQIKIELLKQLTQELRTPLTSVMGMASVLSRETFGPLTGKQKEYLEIIHKSGQHLLSLVNEIVEIGSLEDFNQDLKLASVDIEMLCQQAIHSLEHLAERQEQEIRLSVEPGNRIWILDKTVVRQILYHLVLCVIQSATAESVIRVHVSRKNQALNIAVWVSHPWLGEGLPHSELDSYQLTLYEEASLDLNIEKSADSVAIVSTLGDRVHNAYEQSLLESYAQNGETLQPVVAKPEVDVEKATVGNNPSESLRLVLSRQLVQLHNGQLSIQGSLESGYRFVVSLPDLANMSQ